MGLKYLQNLASKPLKEGQSYVIKPEPIVLQPLYAPALGRNVAVAAPVHAMRMPMPNLNYFNGFWGAPVANSWGPNFGNAQLNHSLAKLNPDKYVEITRDEDMEIQQQNDYFKPVLHPWFKERGIKIMDAECGEGGSLLIGDDKICYCLDKEWDRFTGIRLDKSEWKGPKIFELPSVRDKGVMVRVKVKGIGCGYNHCVVVSVNDKVYLWGDNGYNQCGVLKKSLKKKYKMSRKDYIYFEEPLRYTKKDIGIKKNDTIVRVIGFHFSTMIVSAGV